MHSIALPLRRLDLVVNKFYSGHGLKQEEDIHEYDCQNIRKPSLTYFDLEFSKLSR